MEKQLVSIYRNRQTGEFKIQPCARIGGAPQEFGPQTKLSSTVADGELLAEILRNLDKSDTQTYDMASAPKYSTEEYRRMLKEQQLLKVRPVENGFKLTPFCKMQNSFGSIDSLTTIVPFDDFLANGGCWVRKMFEKIDRD